MIKKAPVAPPVFRPQPARQIVQPKMANVAVSRKTPVAPPVYNPNPRRTAVQPKMNVGPRVPVVPVHGVKRPVGPPEYKPQPPQRVLQARAMPKPGAPAQIRKPPVGPPAPPVRPPQLQLKKATSPVVKPNRVQAPARNTIQRQISFTHGPRHYQVNVAESLSRVIDFGITRTTLNGRAFPSGPGSEDAFVAALLEPAILLERTSHGVAVSVRSVAIQNLSYIMELPTRAAWQLQVDAQNIRTKLANQPIHPSVNIPIGETETGNLTLHVRGRPTDNAFTDMVETHEEVHVGDIRTAISRVLRPWDARLTDLCREGTRFEGINEVSATARLYEAAGGTPTEVAQRFVAMLKEMGRAFHLTPEGQGPVIVAAAKSGIFTKTLTVDLQHRNSLVALHQQKLEAIRREEQERRAYQQALQESLERPVGAPINAGGLGNSFITNDML